MYVKAEISVSSCAAVSSGTVIIPTITAPDVTTSITGSSICSGATGSIKVEQAVTGVSYQLRDASGTNTISAGAADGAGWLFEVPSMSQTTDYEIYAIFGTSCEIRVNTARIEVTQVNPPVLNGTFTACVGIDTLTYAIVQETGHNYTWTILGGEEIAGNTADNISIKWTGIPASITIMDEIVAIAGCVAQKTFDISVQSSTPSIVCAPGLSLEADIESTSNDQYIYTVQGTELDPISTSDVCGVMLLVNSLSDTSSMAGNQIVFSLPAGQPVYTQKITWTATNHAQVSASCDVEISLKINDQIRVPSAFSPNEDDNNDEWIIANSDRYPDIKIQVFNRWGQLVYESEKGYTHKWKGQDNKGNLLPVDSYHYMIFDKNKIVKRGVVTILK